MTRHSFMKERSVAGNHKQWKSFNEAIYNILQVTNIEESTSIKLYKLKAKIMRLYHMAQQ
jgi:hypothetical protein